VRTITDSWLGRVEGLAEERGKEIERLDSSEPTLTQLLYAALEEDSDGRLLRPAPEWSFERWREQLVFGHVHSYVKARTPAGATDYEVEVPDEVMEGFERHAEMRARYIMGIYEGEEVRDRQEKDDAGIYRRGVDRSVGKTQGATARQSATNGSGPTGATSGSTPLATGGGRAPRYPHRRVWHDACNTRGHHYGA